MGRVIALLALLLVTGCLRLGIEPIEWADTDGNDFTKLLAQEYKGLSRHEAERNDWGDANYFAEKGGRVASGVHVDPEHPEDWDIPKDMIEPLKQARRELLDAVTSSIIFSHPKHAARAYLLYDCWVERQEETWNPQLIEPCREEFFEVMNYLSVINHEAVEVEEADIEEMPADEEETLTTDETTEQGLPWSEAEKQEDPVSEKDEMEPAEEADLANEAEAPSTEEPTSSDNIVYFDFDKSDLSDDDMEVIEATYEYISELEEYSVVLNGHTDRAGPEAYNLRLSRKRAEAVRDALIALGAESLWIQAYGFGESDNARPTEDGEKEPLNRRVEIVVE